MSQMLGGDTISRKWEAVSTVSATLYHFVEDGAAEGEVDVCDGAGDVPIGICVDPGKLSSSTATVAGNSCAIQIGGTCKLKISDTVYGNVSLLGTTTDGTGVVKSADHDIVRAIALEDGVTGDIIEVLLVWFTISA